MAYTHLSERERIITETLRKEGKSAAEIGRRLGRDPETIRREWRRNGVKNRCYNGTVADRRARRRRKKASKKPRKVKGKLLRSVNAKFKKGWPPDVIAHFTDGISTSGLYAHLHRLHRKGSHHCPPRLVRANAEVFPLNKLPYGLGKQKRKGKRAPLSPMTAAAPIKDRPALVGKRSRLGDYEADTAALRGGALAVCLERFSRYMDAALLHSKNADAVAAKTKRMLSGRKVRTITSDRGTEFSRWPEIEQHFGAKWYVCDPRRPDQRGSVEGAIRQLRRFLPTSTLASSVTPAMVARAVRILNNTPRKSLGYKTPAEVMKEV